jgi:Mrp family chromosome partitioning ATPase/capsular polysaccharide biosynthesis protein
MELVYLYRIVLRNKWTILKASLATLVIGFLFTFTIKEKYKSQSQISTGFTLSQEIILSDNIFDQSQINVKFENVIENMTSPKVLNLLIYQLALKDLQSTEPSIKSKVEDVLKDRSLEGLTLEMAISILDRSHNQMLLLDLKEPNQKMTNDLILKLGYNIKNIKENLDVSRHENTDFIDISYLSEKTEISEFIVNSIIKEFLRYYENTMRFRSDESFTAIDSIVKKRKEELDEKVKIKMNFMKDSFSIKIDPNVVGASKMTQASSYETSLADELAKEQSINYQLTEIEAQLLSIPASNANAPNPENSNRQFAEIRRQYNDLYDQYVKSGSSDPLKKAQLDDLQKKMQLAAKAPNTTSATATTNQANIRNSLTQKKIELEASLKSISSKIAFFKQKLAGTAGAAYTKTTGNSSAARLEQLDKDIEWATNEYMSAKERSTKAASVTDTGISNFKQTLFGEAALNPEPSKKIVIIAISGMMGAIISILFFVVLGLLDQSIKNPEQFTRMTGLPLLATINFIDLKGKNLKDHITGFNQVEANRSNIFREFFRKFRYEIEKSGKRVILFTSTEPQQGKTTLIQALSLSLSLSNRKVLIIDTNFCNNDLTMYNNAKPTLENISVKAGKLEKEEILKYVSPNRFENVDIIGCRGGDYTPSEILPKDNILEYLPDLLKVYDFILLEGAPLSGFTDTKELAKYADGIIGIFSASMIIKHSDKESIKFFKTVPEKFIGAVLNKISSEELEIKK